ncbi:MAG: MFS transporter [Rhizobiales bacterium]|nr:MFS transporter [Hyphomicrobiales bacterium]
MTAAESSSPSTASRIAVAIIGYCAFINLYSPQALLPLLQQEFAASAADVSYLITVSVLAVALTAPFTGTVSDVLGRRRVILAAMAFVGLPAIFGAMSHSLTELMIWRFVQGLALPPIFAVAIAYIGDEFPPRQATAAIGLYTAGSSLGGFSGRFFTGLITDIADWRVAFITLALINITGAIIVFFLLPREKRFVRSPGLLVSARQMLAHLRNPRLVATYAVGFCVLFNFVSIFTFINFHLAAPPYLLTPSLLGAIFLTYLMGSVTTPLVGHLVARFGRRNLMIELVFIWMFGVLLTLATPLPLIIVGLMICAAAGLMCQAVSTGYVTVSTPTGRSSAVGLYATSFYVGGACGGVLGSIAWTIGDYPACVVLAVAVLAIIAAIVAAFWDSSGRAPIPPQHGSPPA